MRVSGHCGSFAEKGFWKKCAAMAAAAVLAFSTVPAQAVLADELDPGADCSMTGIIPSDLEYYEDVKNANVVMDYYKVADVVPDSIGASYTLEPVGIFTGIGIPLALTPEEIEQDYGSYSAYSDAVSQKAASLLLDSIGVKEDPQNGPGSGSVPAPSGANEGRVPFDGNLKAAVSGLEPGMYLCLAHGSGDSYKRTVDGFISTVAYYITQKTTTKTTESSTETKVETTTETNYKYYLFTPMLITVPYYEVDGEEIDGRRVYYSFIGGGDQEWLYDIEFVFKADNGQKIVPDSNVERTPKPGRTVVRTGDDTDLLPYVLALAVGGVLLVSVIIMRLGGRKKN